MKNQKRKRSGFTLIELLVVITIITILVTITLGGLSVVRKQSNIDRTQRTVQKINFLLMEKLEQYQTRRMGEYVKFFAAEIQQPTETPYQALARARVTALRDLIRLEMPDRYSEINAATLEENSLLAPYLSLSSLLPAKWPKPSLLRHYRRKYQAALDAANGDPIKEAAVNNHAAAELLFMIIMSMPNASEQFAEYEIGDYDNDGLKEFIDAWGNPIRFIRWPAGFVVEYGAVTDLQKTSEPDPFDSHNLIAGDYGLVPLVYSAGPDKIYDINRGVSGTGDFQYSLDATGNLRTCVKDNNTPVHYIGEPLDGTALDGSAKNGDLDHDDNITNHMMDF